jgi:hypothetical protein
LYSFKADSFNGTEIWKNKSKENFNNH